MAYIKKHYIRLNMNRQSDVEVITMISQDTYSNELRIKLLDQGTAIDLSDVETVTLTFDKPDATIVVSSAEVTSPLTGNIVCPVDIQAIAVVGTVNVQVQLSYEDGTITSSSEFPIEVVDDPYAGTDGDVASTSEYTVLTDLITTVNQMNITAYTQTELDEGVLDDRYYTEDQLEDGALNILYYTETEIDDYLSLINQTLAELATVAYEEQIIPSIIMDTSEKPRRYLEGDTSTFNYFKEYQQYQQYITAEVDFDVDEVTPLEEQHTTVDGTPIFWTDESQAQMTYVDTGIPVMVYQYTEVIKLQLYFEMDDVSGYYIPVMEWGQGDGVTEMSGKAIIKKDTEALKFIYYSNNTGTERKITIGDYGVFASVTLFDVSTSSNVLSDHAGQMVKCTNTSDITLTVQPESSIDIPIGVEISFAQYGTGTVTFAEGAGVTINSADGLLAIGGQYHAVTLKKMASDEWLLVGNLA